MSILVEKRGAVTTMTINRPATRNAIDRSTAAALADAFRAFDADPDVTVAVLCGANGHSRALDLILTGRPVGADEALAIGLANRVVEDGQSRAAAEALAAQIAAFPQTCMRHDRLSSYEQWGLPLAEALQNECRHGRISLDSGDAISGADRFREGEGRHGRF